MITLVVNHLCTQYLFAVFRIGLTLFPHIGFSPLARINPNGLVSLLLGLNEFINRILYSLFLLVWRDVDLSNFLFGLILNQFRSSLWQLTAGFLRIGWNRLGIVLFSLALITSHRFLLICFTLCLSCRTFRFTFFLSFSSETFLSLSLSLGWCTLYLFPLVLKPSVFIINSPIILISSTKLLCRISWFMGFQPCQSCSCTSCPLALRHILNPSWQWFIIIIHLDFHMISSLANLSDFIHFNSHFLKWLFCQPVTFGILLCTIWKLSYLFTSILSRNFCFVFSSNFFTQSFICLLVIPHQMLGTTL